MNSSPKNNKPYPKLTVSILSYRPDLLQITVNSLIPHLSKIPDWDMVILNHSGDQQEGMNKLAEMWDGEFLLHCQDDWFFFPQPDLRSDWINWGIEILEKYPEVRYIVLRVDSDRDCSTTTVKEVEPNGMIIKGPGFQLAPFIARTEIVKRVLKVAAENKEDVTFPQKCFHAAQELGLNGVSAKLKLWDKGSCVHIGRNFHFKSTG